MESVRVATTKGQWTWIEEEDYPSVSRFNWHLNEKGHGNYVQTYIKGYGYISLHTFLMRPPDGLLVDHIDGDGLNNRRSNLRIATQSQNLMNMRGRRGASSHFKGVTRDSDRDCWVVRITKDRKATWIGRFDDEIEAAVAYNEAAVLHFGEWARLNVIPELV